MADTDRENVNRKRILTTINSPYFDKRPHSKSPPNGISPTCSRHFLQSSCSAWYTFSISAGNHNLLDCLFPSAFMDFSELEFGEAIQEQDSHNQNSGSGWVDLPTDKKAEGTSKKICRHRLRLRQALENFRSCPDIRPEWKVPRGPSCSCLRHVCLQSCQQQNDDFLQDTLRHLCPNKCYLKAYAPFRAWWSLHQSLREYMTGPQGVQEVLKGWKCGLVHLSDSADEARKGLNGASVAFQSPASNLFRSEKEAFKYIIRSLHESTKTGKANFNSPQKECFIRRASPRKRARQPVMPVGTSNVRYSVSFSLSPLATADELPTESRKSIQLAQMDVRALWSPFGLLEELFVHDPWKLLLSTILLNRTTRAQVDSVLYAFLEEWPTFEDVIRATDDDESHHYFSTKMSWLLRPTGMRWRRTSGIIRFCHDYQRLLLLRSKCGSLTKPTQLVDRSFSRSDIQSLYNCGEYASDAYQIFIQQKFWNVEPRDRALKAYVDYKRCCVKISSM